MHKPQPAARHAQRAQQHWKTGVAHGKAQRWPAAVCEFARATTLAPLESIYWLNLARAHARLEQYAAAADAARKSFDLDRSCVLAARLLAECMVKQYRYAEAVTCFEQLDPAAPRDHDLLAAHGVALLHSDRLRDAIAVFFRALALKIDNPLVHYHMGLAFKDLNMKVEAAECFRTAVTLDDGGVRILALALLVQESRQACQWGQLADDTRALRQAASTLHDAAGGGLLSPFAFLAVDCTPAEQLSVGRWRATVLGDAVPRLPALPKQRAPGRIRLGYLSSDFYNHATAMLMAELLERRDASRFEVFLYSHSRDDGSALRARVMAACDHFVDVTNLGNAATSERIRADGIDILVDLKGHTRDSRFELLAARPAPVQVSWLGFPGTTGADYVDYVIGDAVVTPLAHAAHFSEKIAQMPCSYQPNDRQRARPASPGRAACGLPEDALVLCCFNQSYKLSPEVLDAWARVMRSAPGGILWMLAWNPQAEANLLRELAQRGVAASRVVFAPKLLLDAHLARLRCADLFLDTWPCNAHTTASEALWMGVPVLTLPGATFASRVAASLLRACELDELVCDSADAYVATAVALASDRGRLRALQRHLDDKRLALPLFDTDRYARDYEALLLRMADRAAQGLPPAHLEASQSAI